MNETFPCGDHGALVSYLYDECAPTERRAIAAHAAICHLCAEELRSLGATREQLTAWTPPDVQLGFRIVSDAPTSDAPGSNVLRPMTARWWNRPMPAWAQAAAAAVIFATGVTLGAVRGTTAVDRGTAAPQRASVTVAGTNGAGTSGAGVSAAGVSGTVTRADLAALEQRLRSEMTQVRTASASVATATSPADERILERVRAMIDDSEQRQKRELALRSAEMVRDFDAQRSDDMVRIERTLGQIDGTTGVEVAQQRQMLNYLMRVSQRGQ